MKRWLAGVITIAATFLLTFAFVWVVSVALKKGDDAVRLPLLMGEGSGGGQSGEPGRN